MLAAKATLSLRAAALMLVLSFGCSACGAIDRNTSDAPAATPEPAKQPELVLRFDRGTTFGEDASQLTNDGTSEVDLQVRTTGDAHIKVVDGPDGSRAIRFPANTGAQNEPVAVVVAHPRHGAESDAALAPGSRDFTFGATISQDAVSDGKITDNGDNLVQRGSYDDLGQFKLQLDGHRPSCRILGDAGELLVEADAHVKPGEWYDVTCSRKATEVVLSMAPVSDPDSKQTWRSAGATGRLRLGSVPLSIGGKVLPDGSPLVSSADQFNGAVDNVFLDIE
jgi:hypothetical protein